MSVASTDSASPVPTSHDRPALCVGMACAGSLALTALTQGVTGPEAFVVSLPFLRGLQVAVTPPRRVHLNPAS
jgi:hypothetical protein